MNLRQLEIFKAVCEETSFSKAAEKLHVTQPAVSQAVALLEAEAGSPLLERIGKKVSVTESGRLFALKVSELIEKYKEAENVLHGKKIKQTVRLGCCITIANTFLPAVMKRFTALFPDVSLEVGIEIAGNVREKLCGGRFDMALIEGAVTDAALYAEPFSFFELSVIASPDNPLSENREISLDAFLKQPLLLREKGSSIRTVLDSALYLRHREALPVMTSVNSQAIIEAVKANVGISVLPRVIVNRDAEKGRLRLLSVRDMPLINENFWAVRKDKKLTAPLKALRDLAKSAAKERTGV